mgnify:CR=1 FL=1
MPMTSDEIERLRDQIRFANNKAVECDIDGDQAALSSWEGYASALRWVEATYSPVGEG